MVTKTITLVHNCVQLLHNFLFTLSTVLKKCYLFIYFLVGLKKAVERHLTEHLQWDLDPD